VRLGQVDAGLDRTVPAGELGVEQVGPGRAEPGLGPDGRRARGGRGRQSGLVRAEPGTAEPGAAEAGLAEARLARLSDRGPEAGLATVHKRPAGARLDQIRPGRAETRLAAAERELRKTRTRTAEPRLAADPSGDGLIDRGATSAASGERRAADQSAHRIVVAVSRLGCSSVATAINTPAATKASPVILNRRPMALPFSLHPVPKSHLTLLCTLIPSRRRNHPLTPLLGDQRGADDASPAAHDHHGLRPG